MPGRFFGRPKRSGNGSDLSEGIGESIQSQGDSGIGGFGLPATADYGSR